MATMRLACAIALIGLVSLADGARAEFPDKAVEIVVPFAAGGSTDLGARVYAKALQEKWKVPVRVVNMPGGNTAPAVDDVMRAPPDGYKVLMDGLSSSSLLGVVVKTLPYKVTDRTFVTLTMQTPMILAVANDSPFKSLKDVVDAAKKDPASITWTSLGGTGVIDMAFRRLFREIGVDVTKTRAVMSKGGSEAAVQAAGGHVMLGSGSYGSYSSFLAANKVRVLAVFATERSKLLPEVPSTVEQGYKDSIAVQWNGFAGPPKMPRDVIEKWHKSVQELLADPEFVKTLTRISIEPLKGDAADMQKIVENESRVLAELFAAR